MSNLVQEPRRFLPWFRGSLRDFVMWPRLGTWLFVAGLAVANVLLWRRVRVRQRFEAELAEQWRSLDDYIDSRCSTLVHGEETVGYGRVLVFKCVR